MRVARVRLRGRESVEDLTPRMHAMPGHPTVRAGFEALGVLLLLTTGAPAFADAGRGQALFDGICSACHSTTPSDPIRAGAGNPSAIQAALDSVPDMQVVRFIVRGQDIVDLADYLAVRYNVSPPPPSPPPPSPSPPPPPPAVATRLVAVEFHHALLDHYFVSAIPAEIATLDAGTAIRGWLRTGGTFSVWSQSAGVGGASPVCRFYIPPASGDSHFYSASPAECDEVRTRFPQFTHESAEVMAAHLPDGVTGACPASTVPVYRLWNQRVDSNHRYTTSRDTRASMIAGGHVAEGYGPEGVAFCAPL